MAQVVGGVGGIRKRSAPGRLVAHPEGVLVARGGSGLIVCPVVVERIVAKDVVILVVRLDVGIAVLVVVEDENRGIGGSEADVVLERRVVDPDLYADALVEIGV